MNLDFEGFDFGFTAAVEAEVMEDEYDEPLPETPTAKLGDVYQLGRHRLMCGDSTDINRSCAVARSWICF